ncbi:MAG: PHP domain-containing protein, partial [Clostridia bacterium]|nr:PHP domain-containing protein [Clostridia bacterium]
MRFKVDQDLHVHSFLSVCSRDEAQVPQAILDCAVERGLRQVCLTDHYWDERVPCNTRVNWWYEKQDHAHVCSALPLPKAQGVEFLFGCEADMDSDNVIGLSKERCDEFDFIIVATTHFHHM